MARNITSQLDFLTDASHLLAATAPETSAYLMSRRTRLMTEHDLELSDGQRQHICSSCGHIMIPGQGAKLKHEARRAVGTKSRVKGAGGAVVGVSVGVSQQPGDRGICRVLTCGNCSRDTRIPMPPASPLVRKKGAARPDTAAEKAETPRTTANASSKKRAKNRKAGLQALLKSQAADDGAGRGLSLASFIKRE